MNTKHWYQLDQSEVLHILQTRLTGLNAGEVTHRQKTHRNILDTVKEKPCMFLRQFTDTILVLLAASVISEPLIIC